MDKTLDLLTVDVDKLFKQYNVAEIDLVHKRLLDEIELKREELRTMVGERYRDLLKAADTIGDMKQTAGSIIENVHCITERCQQLNDHNLIGFRTGHDHQRLQKKHRDHNFHGVIVQIKLLTSLPEMIWSSIDREDYFVATQLFTFARHISTGLNLDTERETMRKFPVAGKQWQVLSQFFFTIENACRDSLAREQLSMEVASKSLASWLLLESCPIQETLPMFTERRSKAFLGVLDENGTMYGKVKDKLLASLHVLIDTVRLFYECFVDDGTTPNANRRMGGFQRELEHITGDQASPTIQLIKSEDPMILQMVPELIAKFRPRLQTVAALSVDEVRAGANAFLKGIETAVEGSLRRLVSLIPTIKTLQDIKTQAHAFEKPSNWANITTTLGLPDGTDFYGAFYQRLINDRIQCIIKTAWTETVRQTHVDVAQLLQQKPIDLRSYVWKESLDDVPGNLKTALDRSKPSTRKLLMKAKAYTPAFVALIDSLNDRLHGLTSDVASFLASSSRSEIEQVLTYFRQCSVDGIADLVTALKSTQFDPTAERYALLARFLAAVRELCPALRECFLVASPDLRVAWPERKPPSFAITVSDEDPERWEKVAGLLDEESIRFWMLWVELFRSSWPTLSPEVGYGTLLNDFPAWDTVTIEENDENNRAIQSTIRVPSQPSFPLQKHLHSVYELLNAVIPQTIPKPIVCEVVAQLTANLLAHYETLAANEFVAQNQNVALQFYLDVRFLQLMFVGREQKQLNERFGTLIGRFKASIDPFDFDVFYTHLNANVKRSASRLQHFLGAFVCHGSQLASAIGGATATGTAGKLGQQDKNPNILALSSNSLNVMWFPLLPVVHRSPAMLTIGTDVSGGSFDIKDQRKSSTLATTATPESTGGGTAGKGATAKLAPAKDASATAQTYAKGAAAFFGLDKDWFR